MIFLDVVSQGIAKECFIKIEIKFKMNILWPRISSIRRVKELRIINKTDRQVYQHWFQILFGGFFPLRGGEVPPLPPLLFYPKTGNFWPYTTFTHFSFFLALFGPVLARFGPFLILFQAKTPFFALLGEIFLGSNFELWTFCKGGGGLGTNSSLFWQTNLIQKGGGGPWRKKSAKE